MSLGEQWLAFLTGMGACGFIASYLIGSIPFGLILTKLFGYGDIRTIGSGNIGATNVLRTGNKWLAASTLFLDGLKGFLALELTKHITCQNDLLASFFIFANCIAVMLGHIFPVWLKFKGGKGVATAIGALLAIAPLIATGIGALWLAIFLLFRISSLSALSAFCIMTIASFVLDAFGLSIFALMPVCVLTITGILLLTHRQNISRLIKGEEHVWRKK